MSEGGEKIHPEVALYQPQIPQNTGNIGRMVLGFDTKLHLIKPFGFELSDKHLKRAGLDYWKDVDLHLYDDFQEFYSSAMQRQKVIYCFTKYGHQNLKETFLEQNSIMLFGREQDGIELDLLKKYKIQTVYIKMIGPIRSHNLSNTVAMALYDVFSKNNLI